ncbi:MAG: adenylate/guanylate cyclase domain-containing protein [Proteobacteria bacterium]|nr:adenylate/guanylate cyclase domain-containing protein [Pseudomonadota bacterium]
MSTTGRFKHITRFINEGKRLPIYLGIFITVFVLWLQLSAPSFVDDFVQRLEYLIYDQRLAMMPRAEKSPENKIVIVDLDERSLQAEGQYPWNRIKVGQLTEKLRDYGVLVVGFDITFPEPDRSIRDLLAPIDLSKLDSAFNEILTEIEPQINADQYFARAMQSGVDVVLAINFNPQSDASYNELPPSIVNIDEQLAKRITVQDMTGFTGNLKILQDAALGNGSMNQAPDADGIVRRVPLVIRYGEELFPTLSLEMFRVYNFIDSYEIVTQLYGDLDVVTAVRIGQGAGAFEIPTDGFGQVNVPYVGGSSLGNNENFFYISATDVLRDKLSATETAALENSLVLIGTSAPGLGDIRAMPLQQVYPGVEVHANMLNALLSSVATVDVSSGESSTESVFSSFSRAEEIYFPYKPDWESGALFVIITVLGLAMAMLFPHLGAASLAATAITLLIGSVWINFQLWANYKLDFTLVLLLLLIVLVTTANFIYGFLSESQTRKTIKGMFDQYVPPAHIDSMLENPDNYTFEGESKELTVLFSDIRGFTTISEKLSAAELKTLLNDFFTPITEIIFKHNGTIDKYVGDMVMAFWGAPLDDPKHSENAIIAALEMLEKVEELKPEFAERGYPEVNVGVGVNTGFMNVGDMGSTYRRSYTVLGDAVNLGSRLEALTKFYGIRLLIGEETARKLSGFLLRLIDKVKVKGKHEAIECYQPICLEVDADDELKARVAEYHEALDCYYSQDWDAAEERLNDLLQKEPATLLYQVYLERIETLREVELPQDWDGAFTHTSK